MRGEVRRLRSDRRAKGREQTGARYAVILQADYLPLATVIVAPTTTNTIGATFWPEIDVDGVRTFVLVEQLMAVDASRLGDVVDHLEADEMHDVEDRLRDVLSI